MDKTKLDGIPLKNKKKKKTCLLVNCISSFELTFYKKIYKIELVNQFLYFLLFYITLAFT